MLFTSSVNPFGVSNTLQIKVSLDIANVLIIFTLPYIDISRDNQMFSVFLLSFSGKFLILDLEWSLFSDAIFSAKVFLI